MISNEYDTKNLQHKNVPCATNKKKIESFNFYDLLYYKCFNHFPSGHWFFTSLSKDHLNSNNFKYVIGIKHLTGNPHQAL